MGTLQPALAARIHESKSPTAETCKEDVVDLARSQPGIEPTKTEIGWTIVEGVKFSPKVVAPSGKELTLIGAGVRCVRLPHGVELKVTVLGIYADPGIVNHLSQFKGLSADELLIDDVFLYAFLEAPVDKLASVTMLLPLTGEDYADKSGHNTLSNLKERNRCGEAEEHALKEYKDYFKTKSCPPGSTIFFALKKSGLEVSQSLDSSIPKGSECVIRSAYFGQELVSSMISSKGVSPSTRAAFGAGMAALLK